VTQNILSRDRSGNHCDPAAMRREHPQDVAFGTVIDGYDMVSWVSLLAIAALAIPNRLCPLIGLAAGHLLAEIHSFEAAPVERLPLQGRDIDLRIGTMADCAVRRSPVADESGQATGVDPRNPDQLVEFEPSIERLRRAVIGGRGDRRPKHETACGGCRRFD